MAAYLPSETIHSDPPIHTVPFTAAFQPSCVPSDSLSPIHTLPFTPCHSQVLSGLAAYLPIEAVRGARVVVLCNLGAKKLGGVESQGMVLCAKNEVRLLVDDDDFVPRNTPPPNTTHSSETPRSADTRVYRAGQYISVSFL